MDPIITQANDFLVEDLFRGDTSVLTVTITRNGVAEDLTGATVFFTAKAALADLDAVALMAYDSGVGNGIEIDADPTTGIAVITLDPTDAAAAVVDTPYFADVQVKTATGEVFTAAFGQLIFRSDVTQRTT